ncbi:hypothetical protein BpHYR1_050548 [Brachionus plicatilis]|uniref:Uncharacterized protein n=1 Tax=Brachionus plicatilis TaxID=10195 RepID=A0A3M7SAV3_BRAPC|nr:hypothetical protein BpHYR1_050548 [Brachionus plicatilis]
MPIGVTRVLPDEGKYCVKEHLFDIGCYGESKGHSIKHVELSPVTKSGHEFRFGVKLYVEKRLLKVQFHVPKVPWPLSVRGDLVEGLKGEFRGLDAFCQ